MFYEGTEVIRIKDSFSNTLLKKKDGVVIIPSPEFMAPEIIFKEYRKNDYNLI